METDAQPDGDQRHFAADGLRDVFPLRQLSLPRVDGQGTPDHGERDQRRQPDRHDNPRRGSGEKGLDRVKGQGPDRRRGHLFQRRGADQLVSQAGQW